MRGRDYGRAWRRHSSRGALISVAVSDRAARRQRPANQVNSALFPFYSFFFPPPPPHKRMYVICLTICHWVTLGVWTALQYVLQYAGVIIWNVLCTISTIAAKILFALFPLVYPLKSALNDELLHLHILLLMLHCTALNMIRNFIFHINATYYFIIMATESDSLSFCSHCFISGAFAENTLKPAAPTH